MICWRNSASAAQKPRPSSGLLTTREASEILGVSEATVWDMTAKGCLHRVGKRGHWHLYLQSDVEALAERRRIERERLAERKRKWRVRT